MTTIAMVGLVDAGALRREIRRILERGGVLRVQSQQERSQGIQLRVAEPNGRHLRTGTYDGRTFEVLNHPGGVLVNGDSGEIRGGLQSSAAGRVAIGALFLAIPSDPGELGG